MTVPTQDTFRSLCTEGAIVVLTRRLMSDQLTPVLAYRRLVAPDERTAPSFLFESVENGSTVGRHSFVGAQPALEVIARGHDLEIIDHRHGTRDQRRVDDPLAEMRAIGARWRPAPVELPGVRPAFTGGWVGFAGYDTVRYLEPDKLDWSSAPADDRGLPDVHFGLYRAVAVFDHVEKVVYAFVHVFADEHETPDAAWEAGNAELDDFVRRLQADAVPLPPGEIDLDLGHRPTAPGGNFERDDFERAVQSVKGYIAAGDAFQVVLSQRFERRTTADPFEIYRALRIVNPSPYMIYLQARGCILVASSPEILCRCEGDLVTNRPLAGTRPRGATPEADRRLEDELLRDEKERAEHVMLVDLGRNDLGRVCSVGTIDLPKLLEVERYSHVMHLSSTVTGRLRGDLDAWDLLRATLPVGTVSGAPKVRAMQIIDQLEPTRRGPYGGGIGYLDFGGHMDIALALRTIVVPVAARTDGAWSIHIQAGAGIVADSVPASEYEETVSKAAALARAIDLAERAFHTGPASRAPGAGRSGQ